jgi:hypothetical protein
MKTFKRIRETRSRDLIRRFMEYVSTAKTKEEIREAEMALLKPKPIPKYNGAKPGLTDVQKKTVTLVFARKKYIDLLGQYIKINKFKGFNSHETELIEALLDMLEEGKLKWENGNLIVKQQTVEGSGTKTKLISRRKK